MGKLTLFGPNIRPDRAKKKIQNIYENLQITNLLFIVINTPQYHIN